MRPGQRQGRLWRQLARGTKGSWAWPLRGEDGTGPGEEPGETAPRLSLPNPGHTAAPSLGLWVQHSCACDPRPCPLTSPLETQGKHSDSPRCLHHQAWGLKGTA